MRIQRFLDRFAKLYLFFKCTRTRLFNKSSSLILGESVQVRVCETQDDTSKLLNKVLDGRQGAADILAKLVHSDISPSDVKIEESLAKVPDEDDINVDDYGIWIDPIGNR